MAGIGFATPSVEVEPSLKPLTAEQMKRFAELDQQLKAAPEPVIQAHSQEERRRRLLRWLRAENFNVSLVYNKMMNHAKWWTAYGMDDFCPEDEYDETGTFFVCGKDLWGRPTAIARPAAHHATTHEESITAARRAIFTLQRLVERMPPGLEQFVIIFDARGLTRSNLDMTFAKELIPLIERNFPGRLHRVVVINEHWGLTFFWAAISVMLPSCVKAKITFAGSKFQQVLEQLVDDTHPYLRYAVDVKQNPQANVPFPASAPYVARCYEGSEFSSDGLDEAESVGSTVASPTDQSNAKADKNESMVDLERLHMSVCSEDFFDCIEVGDEEIVSISPKRAASTHSNWTSHLFCSCGQKP